MGLEKNVRKKGFKRATKSLMIKKLTTIALEVANEDEVGGPARGELLEAVAEHHSPRAGCALPDGLTRGERAS